MTSKHREGNVCSAARGLVVPAARRRRLGYGFRSRLHDGLARARAPRGGLAERRGGLRLRGERAREAEPRHFGRVGIRLREAVDDGAFRPQQRRDVFGGVRRGRGERARAAADSQRRRAADSRRRRERGAGVEECYERALGHVLDRCEATDDSSDE